MVAVGATEASHQARVTAARRLRGARRTASTRTAATRVAPAKAQAARACGESAANHVEISMGARRQGTSAATVARERTGPSVATAALALPGTAPWPSAQARSDA